MLPFFTICCRFKHLRGNLVFYFINPQGRGSRNNILVGYVVSTRSYATVSKKNENMQNRILFSLIFEISGRFTLPTVFRTPAMHNADAVCIGFIF